MNKTKIEWTDFSWNPVTGCRHGCYYCYAESMYRRFGRSFEPRFHPERLSQPLRKNGPMRIFVGSVTDMFGDWVPEEWHSAIFDVIRQCPEKTFQFLTKNPKRLKDLSPYPQNCWVGVTAINQAAANTAIEHLAEVSAPVKYLSCEPLSGPIRLDVKRFPPAINWLIIGACTGAHRFQPDRQWVDALTADGRSIGAAVFYKPNLIHSAPPLEYPTPLISESPFPLFQRVENISG